MLVTALDAGSGSGRTRITRITRITFANMAFTDDPGVQRQAAAESAANITKDLGIALERIGIKSIEGLSGMREYGTAVPGSGSAIDRFSTAENTSRSDVLCQPEVRLIPSTVARVGINFPSIQTWKRLLRSIQGKSPDKHVALFLISSPTIFTRFTARKTRRCSHMPL